VEVSSNNGSSWQTVKAYNGVMTTWTEQNIDITSFANSSSQLKIRFRLQSDQGVVADGWYIDDIKLKNYSPLINSVVTNLQLTLAQEGLYNSAQNSLNMNDTVSVYLKSVTSPYQNIDSSRGVIDSLTFTGNFGFRNAPSGNYFIMVKHRNSIETWSKAGGEEYNFGGTLSYDFTSSVSQAFGDNMILTGSTYCIFSREVAESLGLDVESGLAVPIRTATGSFLSFQHEVTLTVGEFEMIALCGFAAHAGFQRNVLGRHGFLMRTKLGIDDYNGLLYLDRNV